MVLSLGISSFIGKTMYDAGEFNINDDLDGNGHFDVAIRSALQIDNNLYGYAGGGILKGSTEINEWDETEIKFQHLLSLINSNKQL